MTHRTMSERSTSELRPAPSIPDTTIFVVSGGNKVYIKKIIIIKK